MTKVHRISKLWQLYLEIVHNTLFFEILHQLPNSFGYVLRATSKLMEQHGTVVAFLLAVLVSVLRHWLATRTAEPPAEPKVETKDGPKRDKKGRFAKASRKES